jgi:uncharacterized membrane protein YuzA (DUF378 family)
MGMKYFVYAVMMVCSLLGALLLGAVAVYGFYMGVCVAVGKASYSSAITSVLLGIVGLICSQLWHATVQQLKEAYRND